MKLTKEQLIQILSDHGEGYDRDCGEYWGCDGDTPACEAADDARKWLAHVADLILEAEAAK